MLSRLCTSYLLASLCLEPMLAAQEREFGLRGEGDSSRSSAPAPSVTLHPAENEMLQPERGAATPTPQPPIPLEAPIDPRVYVCGRGDVFDLNFWGQQNFKVRVTVDLEGRTFIPKVGYVEVVGKTLADSRDIIRKAVHRYYPGLSFDLSLAAPRSFVIHIVGFVDHPGEYVANAVERVGTALATASTAPRIQSAAAALQGAGAQVFEARAPSDVVHGSRRRVDIKHRTGTHQTADLVLYDLTGDVKYNPMLSDGDVVTVPAPELSTTVTGAVKRPGRYELVSTRDLAELIEIAGGAKSSLTRSLPIRLLHRDEQEHWTESRIEFPKSGAMANFPLHDGDMVNLPDVSDLQRSVSIVGPVAGAASADEVTAVRRVAFYNGATAGRLVEQIGGIGGSADLSAAYIRRNDGATLRVDLETVLVRRDFSADRPVAIGDTVVIPQKRRGIAVEGAVLHASIYPYNPDFRAGQYVAVAGGPRSSARPTGDYRVISAAGRERKFNVELGLNPGDTIVIPERSFTRSEVVQLVLGGVGLAVSMFTLVYLVVK